MYQQIVYTVLRSTVKLFNMLVLSSYAMEHNKHVYYIISTVYCALRSIGQENNRFLAADSRL